jgi:hypothetical protein
MTLDQIGIFRISGTLTALKKLTTAILENDLEYVLHIKDPNVVAGALKKFFRDLKTPLFPYDHYEKLKHIKS